MYVIQFILEYTFISLNPTVYSLCCVKVNSGIKSKVPIEPVKSYKGLVRVVKLFWVVFQIEE